MTDHAGMPRPLSRRLTRRLASRYRRLPETGLLRRRLRGFARRVGQLERTPAPAGGGAWYDLGTNGEAALIARLAAATVVDTVVDVGANTGEWYSAVRAAIPDARIVCVEIAPPLWQGLEELLESDPRAELATYGLGAEDGHRTLRFFPALPALTTLVAFPHDGEFDELDVAVRSVEGFLEDFDLRRIDLMKVDVEGVELPIVEGLVTLLDVGAVGVVQFEYGEANILTRSPLHAYAEIAERSGYQLGEVRPEGVVFAPYGFEQEDYRPRNMVLCRPDLAPALQVPTTG